MPCLRSPYRTSRSQRDIEVRVESQATSSAAATTALTTANTSRREALQCRARMTAPSKIPGCSARRSYPRRHALQGAYHLVDDAARRTYTHPVEDGSSVVRVANEGDGAPEAVAGNLPLRRPPKSRVNHTAEQDALRAASAGCPNEAVKILMRAYGQPVTAFAIRLLRETEPANDVRQQVFLEALQGLKTFKGTSSLWSWLCGIAYHRCMDELRRNRRNGAAETLDILDQLVSQIDPAMDVDQVAERRALERCLAKLAAPMRSQLLMRYLLGLSHMEIGEIVHAAHSTVQVRISRILPQLRQCLRGEGVAR